MNLPLNLFFKSKLVAKVVTFNYETPWASGEVVFENKELFQKMVNVTLMSDFEDQLDEFNLSENEEEIQWEQKLWQLDLSYDDLILTRDIYWMIQESSKERVNIFAVRFDQKGFIDWRF